MLKHSASAAPSIATDSVRDRNEQSGDSARHRAAEGGSERRTNATSGAETNFRHSPRPEGELIRLLDITSARETVDRLGMEDLRYLNKLIVERIKFLMQCKKKFDLMEFNPGNRVRFTSSSGEEKKGTVIRVNRKTVSVAVDGEPGWWKVSPELLMRINSPPA